MENIFGDFSETGIVNGITSLIRMKIREHAYFSKIVRKDIPFNRIKTNIDLNTFGDFSEQDLIKGIDTVVSSILKQYLIVFYKSKPVELSSFGCFNEEDLANGISGLVNIRLAESLSYWEYQNNNQPPQKQDLFKASRPSTNELRKICLKCNALLPYFTFSKSAKNEDGLTKWCDKCLIQLNEDRKNNSNKKKQCPNCKRTRLKTSFYTNGKRGDGLTKWCKDCMNKAAR